MMQAIWTFPEQAKFGRIVPKNKIYEHSAASSLTKSLFVEQVEQISWDYKLSPSTLNLPKANGINEIQVFTIKLKGDMLSHNTLENHRLGNKVLDNNVLSNNILSCNVLKAIDSAIPFPILFVIVTADGAQLSYAACFKRFAANDSHKWICSRYLCSKPLSIDQEYIDQTSNRIALPTAINMDELYQQLLDRLLPIVRRPLESIEDAITRWVDRQTLEKQIKQQQNKIVTEKQFNRKVTLNSKLKTLKNQLAALAD